MTLFHQASTEFTTTRRRRLHIANIINLGQNTDIRSASLVTGEYLTSLNGQVSKPHFWFEYPVGLMYLLQNSNILMITYEDDIKAELFCERRKVNK